ncbi:ribonuclease catalytic domain-containing protein, partial [Methylobacterium hispanicum]
MTEPFRGVTVDPVGAADLDDAVWIERDGRGWTVQVAFPRLTEVVRIGSHADETARHRVETSYRPGGVAKHMLPEETMKAASLTPGADKPVFLVTILLDGSFRTVSTSVAKTTFRSLGRLTYDEASRSVRTRDGIFAEMLGQARDLAHGLFERRRSSGAIAFYDLERGIAFDEEGSAILLTGEGHVAEMIVSELMVLANAQLAAFAAERNIPLLYRNHEARSGLTRAQILETLQGVAADVRADVRTDGFPRVVGKAYVGPEPKGHYALNLPAYAWFTSPLRRYVDLVNQRMVEASLDGAPAPHTAAAIEAIAGEIEAKRNASADRLTSSYRRRYAREATAIIARGGIREADDLQFRRVVRAIAADPAAATEAVVEEGVRRIAEELLTPKEIARLLILGGRTAAAVVERLTAAPHEANNVLAYGTASLGWSQADFAEKRSGSPHAPVFACTGRMTVDGVELVTPLVVRPTRKGAQHAAGVHL